jgi:hypothetical protein
VSLPAPQSVTVAAKRHEPSVAQDDDAYLEFQRYVWNRLPIRKYLCGMERVFDAVSVVVQEWPVEAIDHSQSGETAEVHALEELSKSCKRHLALLYGEEHWEVWETSMTPMIWQSVWSVLQWYRHAETNAAALYRWRSKWRYRKRGK